MDQPSSVSSNRAKKKTDGWTDGNGTRWTGSIGSEKRLGARLVNVTTPGSAAACLLGEVYKKFAQI
jgi:hypothetical protein